MNITVFWHVTPFMLIDRHQRLGRNFLPLFSRKMEATGFSETFTPIYHDARRHIIEYINRQKEFDLHATSTYQNSHKQIYPCSYQAQL
jgi:hypothetical protein